MYRKTGSVQSIVPEKETNCTGRIEENDMKYTKRIIMLVIVHIAILAVGVTAAAKSTQVSNAVKTVEPANAVIAAVLALLAGGVIFILRHR